MSQDGCALDWDTICREVSATYGAKPPMPDRFEMGPVARDRLLATAPKVDMVYGQLLTFWGVRIVLDVQLAPEEWRLIDTEGQTLAAGRIECQHTTWLDITPIECSERTELCRDCSELRRRSRVTGEVLT